MSREITSVIHESEGRSASHRLHLDPDEIQSSRHHHLEAIPDDADSDESDEWDAQESEEEWEECAGDLMYRDYRRMQRGTFLVAHIRRREEAVRRELGRWFRLMERLGACKAEKCISSGSISQSGTENGEEDVREEFGLDCHDLSLENVFVDEKDHTRITCVIDWESTTTRPLWACAHLPAFVQSSPFTARLFRETVAHIATGHSLSPSTDSLHSQSASNSHLLDLSAVASEWLHYESWGARLRHAHRCAEWDGWEEGLVDSILGPEDTEEEWFKEGCACEDVDKPGGVDDECVCDEQGGKNGKGGLSPTNGETMEHARWQSPLPAVVSSAVVSHTAGLPAPSVAATLSNHTIAPMVSRPSTPSAALRVQRRQVGKLILKKEREREQTLVSAGDICGGRGGELGRRLEELVRRGLGAG
ncbi:hypothetical protein ID866_6355 [Astraeus odoratus]|nr:hypothetical protein ID866_6355 [Astraeus odoratus]